MTGDQIFVNAGCSPSPLRVKGAAKQKEFSIPPRSWSWRGTSAYRGHWWRSRWLRVRADDEAFRCQGQHRPAGSSSATEEDQDVSEEIENIFTEAGIDVYLGAKVKEVSNVTLAQVVVSLTQSDGSPKSLLCSHLLAAAGWTPNTADLGLESAGVGMDKHGYIKANEHLATTAPDVWALGDIKGGLQQTHVSYDDMRALRHNLISHVNSGEKASIQGRLIPYTIFMDPQLGRMGLSEREACAPNPPRNIKVAKMSMAYVARALEMDESKGFMKGVVDADTKEIHGFTCLGIEGGEIMSMVQLAMVSPYPGLF